MMMKRLLALFETSDPRADENKTMLELLLNNNLLLWNKSEHRTINGKSHFLFNYELEHPMNVSEVDRI